MNVRSSLRRAIRTAAAGLVLAPSVLLVAVSATGAVRAAANGPFVYVATATGVVDNVMAGYIEESVRKAAGDGAKALVIRLNTPGGSLDSTQRIVTALLDAPVPTIVWVAPNGGRAASAGTFITLAAHLAYMAPATNIGAASPVGSNGEDIPGTLGDKVRNDAIKNITAISETRNRNVAWAVSAVADAKSASADEAVQLHVVDGIAATLDDVLAQADKKAVHTTVGDVTLAVADAAPVELALNPFQGLLHLLSDPNIAFILFTLGFYGLLFELQSPNFVTGILGALAIILAFVGFGSLPLNIAGLLLIGLAVVLFMLEPTVTSHGLLTIGGLVSLAVGASALYTTPGDPAAPLVAVATPLIAVSSMTFAAFAGLIAVAIARNRTLVPSPGLVGTSPGLPDGTVGVVRRPLEPTGSVYAAGEEWTARTADGQSIPRGTSIHVVGMEGLTAIVEPDPGSAS